MTIHIHIADQIVRDSPSYLRGSSYSPITTAVALARMQGGYESRIHSYIASLVGIDDVDGLVKVDTIEPIASGTNGDFIQQLGSIGEEAGVEFPFRICGTVSLIISIWFHPMRIREVKTNVELCILVETGVFVVLHLYPFVVGIFLKHEGTFLAPFGGVGGRKEKYTIAIETGQVHLELTLLSHGFALDTLTTTNGNKFGVNCNLTLQVAVTQKSGITCPIGPAVGGKPSTGFDHGIKVAHDIFTSSRTERSEVTFLHWVGLE